MHWPYRNWLQQTRRPLRPRAARLLSYFVRRQGFFALPGGVEVVILLKTLFQAACAVAIFGVITWQLQRLDPFLPVTFEFGEGGYNGIHGGAILPDPLRWLWREEK